MSYLFTQCFKIYQILVFYSQQHEWILVVIITIWQSGIVNKFCQLVDPEGVRQDLTFLQSLNVDGVVVQCWWGIVETWTPRNYIWSGYRDLFNIIRHLKLKLQVTNFSFLISHSKSYSHICLLPSFSSCFEASKHNKIHLLIIHASMMQQMQIDDNLCDFKVDFLFNVSSHV